MNIDILGQQPLYRQGVAELVMQICPQVKISHGHNPAVISNAEVGRRVLILCQHRSNCSLMTDALQGAISYDRVILLTAHLGKAQKRLLGKDVDLILPLSITAQEGAHYIKPLLFNSEANIGYRALLDGQLHNRFIPDPSDLTPAERRVLIKVSQGLSNADIATSLRLQVNTVKFQLARARQKLKVRNRTEAACLFNTMLMAH